MAKRRKGRPKVEYVMLLIEVTSVAMYVSHHIESSRASYAPAVNAWLRISGKSDEPLQGHSDLEISLHEATEQRAWEPEKTKSIGALIQVSPSPQLVVDLPTVLFDRAWAMAAGGQLRHIWLSMTKPKGNSALVLSVMFQNVPIE